MIKWFVLFGLLLAQPCFASDNNESEELTSKNVWMHLVQLKLPEEICKPESEYSRCFELTHDECMAMTRWFTSACLENMESRLPTKLTSDDGKKWGAAAGHCVNDLFYKFLASKRIEGDNCPQMPKLDNSDQTLPDPTRPNNE